MKKILLLSTGLIGSLLASCSSELLNTKPQEDKEINTYYQTAEQLEGAVNAAYSKLKTKGQYGLNLLVFGEIPSDNTYDEVPANDSGKFGQLDEFTVHAMNGFLDETWRDHYDGIQQCNIILNRMDAISMDQQIKQNRKGEVLFLRALMYFNLIRIYGDVPLVTTETTDVNVYFGQGRTKVAEVERQIESDLIASIELLPELAAQKGRVTRAAAQGVLAKFYLTQKKYDQALIQLLPIETAGYTLLENPADIFELDNKGNAEIIFDVQFKSGVDGNSQGSTAFQIFSPSGSVSGAKGHNLPTKEIFEVFEQGDLRRDAYLGRTSQGVAFTKKLKKNAAAVEDGGSNIVVLRYADVVLMLAEVQAQLGQFDRAVSYLNQIRKRAAVPAVVFESRESLLEAIALERRKEFVGEGHRWFDLVRTDRAIAVMNAYFQRSALGVKIAIDEHHLLMPVPQSQINTDPAIVQNPGYY